MTSLSTSFFFLKKLYLRQIFFSALFVFLTACGTVPAYTPTPLFSHFPVLTATATETPTLHPPTITLTPTITKTPVPPFRYTVFSGDTCMSLAYTYDVSIESIIVLNNLPPSCPIEPNQQLLIPYPTLSNIPTPTRKPSKPIEVIVVATTLDFHRNGKIYAVKIATAHFIVINRDLYDSLTPPPKIPEKPSDSIVYRAKIKEISDLDKDGEQEYTVLLNECKDWDCADFVSFIKVFKYDPEKDEYYVFKVFQTDPEEIKPNFIS